MGFIAIIILAGLGGAFAVYNFRQFEGELDLLRGTNKKLVDTTVICAQKCIRCPTLIRR